MSNSFFLANALQFTRVLKAAGLPISSSQAQDFCQALTLVDMGQKEQFFYVARGTLVMRQEHLRLFEVLFNLFWRPAITKNGRGQKMPVAPRHNRPRNHPYSLAMLMASKAKRNDQALEIADKAGSFSSSELLQSKDFGHLTIEELETVKKLIQEMRWQVSLRTTRRFTADDSGQRLHLRRCLRAAAKFNGTPLQLAYQSKKIKERPLILLADISGSMEKYARLTLQFFYSVTHSLKTVEAFVFGTRLTRITPQLKLKNIDQAINLAARDVVDWSGGTRIGDSIKQFNREWSRRVLRRGAIVVIMSDGWERGDVSELGREMRYLHHRCHRLIWLNPLSGRVGYQPLVEGMAAALPYIDDFLPIHNLQTLSTLAEHLSKLGNTRPQTADLRPQRKLL
ncbi:MAG: VWA domain-containing protein [Ardenticatenaceae bacterium]|nr:VWA domain-containing protein [Ardenticatenaceae bacterium]